MPKFVTVGTRENGTVTVSSPNIEVEQLAGIETAETVFEMFEDLRTVKLFRADPTTAELTHVQTWTRDAKTAEAEV